MSELESLQKTLSRAAASVGPAVVALGDGWRGGAGVVVAPGQVLTNAHNARGEDVPIRFHAGREAVGHVAGMDIDGDLALVSVETGEIVPVPWADDADVGLGTVVIAVTNPPGSGPRVTLGTVSGTDRAFRGPRGRRIRGSIEHTAPMAPGSSGSPLLSLDGRLIGINTNRMGDGFYLAIPTDGALRERLDMLARGESAEPVRLGVSVLPARIARRLRRSVGLPEREGVLVDGVEDGGPADAAGILRGDLIVSAGKRPIAEFDDLADVLSGARPGSSLALNVVRGADEIALAVSFPMGDQPA